MTVQDEVSPERSDVPGFAAVAKRISVWTTNALVSVLILVAGVGFGRQVLRWWAEDAQQPSPRPLPVAADTLADPFSRHFLEFGDHAWGMSRRTIVGRAEDVRSHLRAETAALTRRAELPADAPGPAEVQLLQRLAGQKPVREESGLWQIHEFDGPFPMVVGTRGGRESFSVSGDGVHEDEQGLARHGKRLPTPSASASGGRELAVLPRRVVTWGLGIPAADSEWAVWTFQCQPGPSQPLPALSEIPVPPDAAKTLAIRIAGGGVIVGFRGPEEPEAWKQFFDQWLRRNGWTAGPWREIGSSWHVGGRGGVGQEQMTVDIQFGRRREGGLSGLLVTTLVSAPIEKDTHP